MTKKNQEIYTLIISQNFFPISKPSTRHEAVFWALRASASFSTGSNFLFEKKPPWDSKLILKPTLVLLLSPQRNRVLSWERRGGGLSRCRRSPEYCFQKNRITSKPWGIICFLPERTEKWLRLHSPHNVFSSHLQWHETITTGVTGDTVKDSQVTLPELQTWLCRYPKRGYSYNLSKKKIEREGELSQGKVNHRKRQKQISPPSFTHSQDVLSSIFALQPNQSRDSRRKKGHKSTHLFQGDVMRCLCMWL